MDVGSPEELEPDTCLLELLLEQQQVTQVPGETIRIMDKHHVEQPGMRRVAQARQRRPVARFVVGATEEEPTVGGLYDFIPRD